MTALSVVMVGSLCRLADSELRIANCVRLKCSDETVHGRGVHAECHVLVPHMTFEDWEREASIRRGGDPLWRMRVHRLASYLSNESWEDARHLSSIKVTASVSDQLYRAVGSITANLAEGYSRSSGRDRARLFEYALGSAREAREWYWRAEPVLGAARVAPRIAILDEIVRLLLAMIPRQRESPRF